MVVKQHYKDFITSQIEKLADYNACRAKSNIYEFHLHSERVAQSMKSLSAKMGYDDAMQDTFYWATLPHDIGKMALPLDMWDKDEKPSDDIKIQRRAHTTKGIGIIRSEFGDECDTSSFLKLLIDIMANHHECMDGTGYQGKIASDLTKEVRMACICDAFDGYSVHRPHFGDRDISPKAVIHRMEFEKAGQFDPDILKQFKEIKL